MYIPTNQTWINQIEYESRVKDLDPYIIQAMCFCESSWKADAVGGECIGLMQIHPFWSKGRNLYDPLTNIEVGTEVYRYYLDTYGSDTSALNHYNGRDTDEPTEYSIKVENIATQIFFQSKGTGYEIGEEQWQIYTNSRQTIRHCL